MFTYNKHETNKFCIFGKNTIYMFRKIIFIAVAVVTSLFTSCRNGSGNNSQSAQTSPESQNISKLEIPEVPSTITDPQLKAEYLIRSFWKNYDFKDTTKLQNESYTEGPLYVYLSVVKKYSNSAVREIYSNFLNGLMNSAPKVREKFLTLIEYNYYHPNSQIRDENLYSMAIDKALLMSSFPKGEAERYLFQKKIMARNNAGSKASDFTLQTKDGSQIALSQIKSKYLVLILFVGYILILVYFSYICSKLKILKMKKLFVAVAALLSFGISFAQEEPKSGSDIKYGAKGGLNIANLVGDDAGDANVFIGFNAGFFIEIPVTDKLVFQPEILYSAQGSKSEGIIDGYNVDATLKFNYINVPLMFKYQVANKFSLEAGPYIGFLTSAKLKFDVEGLGSDTVDMKDDVKSTDFGIGVGMNYEFSDVIFANARYQGGLTEIGDSEAGGNSVKNSVFQIGLGFRF